MTYPDSMWRMIRSTHFVTRRAWFLVIAIATLLTIAVTAAIAVPQARAVSDQEELTRFGSYGAGAGQFIAPNGIGTDPNTGHVYVIDLGNNRINQFTPWGNFVKAFGWDVAPGAVNEQQEVRIRANTGQFRLSFGAETTADLPFDAEAAEVQIALENLATIGAGDVSIEAVPGTPDGKTPSIYVVVFKGSLAASDVAQLTIANGATPLGGGAPSTNLEARTRAEGTGPGTGLESCTEESGCQAGVAGAGPGQLDGLVGGVQIDSTGHVYVHETSEGNHRMQKFDSAGHFLLMFGGEVNKTTKENVCTRAQLEGGDECGIGTVGTAPGQFSDGFFEGSALGPSGQLFAADNERIQRFNLQGEFEASIPVPGHKVRTLFSDPVSGDLYAVFIGENGVHRLDSATGEEISEIKVFNGGGVSATDSAGGLYTAGFIAADPAVFQFDSSGEPLSPASCCGPGAFTSIYALGSSLAGDLYVAYRTLGGSDNFIRLFGPAPVMFEAAPRVPPTIVAQFATSVDRTDAAVKAEINPHFWTDTRYYVEYGTGKCSEGGCEEKKPALPGLMLTSKVTDTSVKGAGIALEGLQPGTVYHYRFIAERSGGGPGAGEEKTFTTYPQSIPVKTNCPSQVFRVGFSAPLPNCRAFEMVSPIDKNNGDIKAGLDSLSFSTTLNQSANDGERFAYSAFRAFANPKGGLYTNQYLAHRVTESGWSSEALAPAHRSILTNYGLENPVKALSPDLCRGWLMVRAEPVLAPGATEGYADLYRRDNCDSEGYEALVQVKPTAAIGGFAPVLQGTSASGKEAIFVVKDKLTEDAASDRWQTYYANGGELHLICVLPNGKPSGRNCSAGTGEGELGNELERLSSVTNAISDDGSKAYWTDFVGDPPVNTMASGKVYLRLHPGEEPTASGECEEAEPEKACTMRVSETASSKPSNFLGASADGSKALIEVTEGAQEGSLFKFDLGAESSTLIAAKGLGVAAASEDLSRVYFVSEEVLPETSGAIAGQSNLYLDQEGTKTFIATASVTTSPQPIFHAAQTTPDGNNLVFISTDSLTGYDNTDQFTGKADSEVYLYQVGSAGPVCVSCNPSGARPQGRLAAVNGTKGIRQSAAWIAQPQLILNSPRVISADGSRLFFNSFDPLLPRDTNGKGDVYEWVRAGSAKECAEVGAELYVAASGGCLSLISSGQSPSDSEFLDASEDGSDVFFTTNSSLLPQDPGLVDVYDARENGGLPAPPEPPGPCQGEACQNAAPPPNDPTPASASFKGAGNLRPTPRCAKGKVTRKRRCVSRKRKGAKKHKSKLDANRNRGASR